MQLTATIMGCQIGAFPCRYLGLPLSLKNTLCGSASIFGGAIGAVPTNMEGSYPPDEWKIHSGSFGPLFITYPCHACPRPTYEDYTCHE